MSTFDIDAYLSGKRNPPGNTRDKLKDILDARAEKLASLDAFSSALAQRSDQALTEQAVKNGRTWGEFGQDIGLSAVQGLDGLAKLPAMVYDKATTGNFYGPETQKISEMSDEREKLKSAFAQASAKQKATIAREDGEAAKAFVGDGPLGTAAQVAAEFGSSFWEAAKDPATLPDFLAQQAASLGVMGKVGRGVEIGVQATARALPTLAATKVGQIAASKGGTAGAVATGAVLQGTDVGSDTMQRLMNLPNELWEQNPEFQELAKEIGPEAAKQSIASEMASKATLAAGAVSLVSSALPGGSAIERALVGKKSFGGAAAVPKAFVGEAGQEGIEEGSGRLFGNTAVQQINPDQDVLEGVGAAAGQGAFLGGALGGGISGLQTLAGKASEAGARQVEKAQQSAAEKAALKAAIDAGDVTSYLDPKSPSYAPDKAVQVLFGNSQKPDATPETKQANLVQASQIVADLQERYDKVREAYASVSLTRVAEYKDQLVQAQADGNTELAGMLQDEINQIESDDASRARLLKQSSDLTDKLVQAQDVLARFNEETQSKDLDVNSEAAKIGSADPVASQAAATSIINLSMAIPERLDVSLATQLADNTANALTVPQRAYLRAFSAAREAENLLKDMGKVSQEIFFGSSQNVGIQQYRERMGAALSSGNKKIADKQLTDLSNFALDHQAKADTAAIALKQFESTGVPVQMLSNANRGWLINTGPAFTEQELRKQGGVQIEARSRKLVESFQKESDALNKAEAELRSAYEIKFGGGSTNVTNVSQALPSTQATSSPATTQTTAQASGSSAGVVTEAGSSTTVGETENVNETAQTQQAEAQGSQVSATDAGTQANAGDVVTEEAPASAASSVDSNTTPSSSGLESTEQVESSSDGVSLSEDTQGLSAFQQKSPEGTSYQARNLVADYFTQSAGKDTDTTKRPLVAAANFLSSKLADLTSYVPITTLSSAQDSAIALFRDTASQWQSTIQKNLVRTNAEFRYTDMMQFLLKEVDGKLDLDENVKTAMSYSGFSSVVEMASRSMYNSDEEINAILDRDETTMVSEEERSLLGTVGVRQNLIVNALGQRAIAALGLKANRDAPMDLMPKLESAMGAHIMKMLMDQGILDRVTVSGADMARLTGNAETNANAQFQFIRLARDASGALNQQAESILQASKGTQNVLDQLFGVESAFKEPTLEPVAFTQKTTRNTSQKVPEKLAKIIEHENQVANYVRQDIVQLVTQLSEEVVLTIAGAENVTENTHATNVIGVQAKKDGLKREYDRFIDFVNRMEDQAAALYFEHIVWKQQRVGISTNAINPQTSKLQRHMLYRKAWESKIEFGNSAQMDNFRLRVLEGLGVKTDKQSNSTSLASYDGKVNNDVIQDAVEVIRTAVFEGGITEAGQQSILAAVKQGGQNFQTLDALVALAHEAQAIKDSKPDFTVQMMNEVDGVTNGPMLSHLLLGAASTVDKLFGLLNRGGFFQLGSAVEQYNQWREQPGHQDLYEITAQHMVENIQKVMAKDAKLGVTFDAVYAFTGDLRENTPKMLKKRRDIVKKPLTSMVFGSAVGKAVDGMADLFVESIYTALEEVSAGTRDRQTTIDHINTLLLTGRAPGIKSLDSDQLVKMTFTPAQVKALKKSFKESVGLAVDQTMQEDFADFMARRKSLNDAAQLSFELYNSAYTALYDSYVAELVAAGEIAVNSKGKPLHGLTLRQDAELKKRVKALAPIVHTPMSDASGSLASGLFASKSERRLSTKSTYSSEIKFGTPFTDNKAASTKTASFETVGTNPGVSMVVMSIHSTDSAISHTAADGNEVLNVHDAHGSGLATFEQTARNLNSATWGQMLGYSPATQMSEMLERTVVGLAQLLQQDNLPAAVRTQIGKVLTDFANKNELDLETALNMVVMQSRDNAFNADKMRLEALSTMQSIDQYALEGGNYQVTDADRAQAKSLQSALSAELAPEVTAALDTIAGQLNTQKVEQTTVPKPKAPITSVFGEIGAPTIQSDTDLVEFFRTNPQATVAQVFKLLAAEGRMNAINRKILGLVIRTVNPDLKIQFVTPNTSESMVLEKATTAARGWYVAMGSSEEIYVLSPEFKDSGLTAETLLHELVHAAIAQAIAKPSADGRELVAELEALRAKAQEYVTQKGLTQYAAALKDVQEFVAWGMTNFEFQKNVLTKIQMESKTGSNVLVSGMKKFIQTLTGLLFKNPDQNLTNGMTVLVNNVSGLFNEVGTARRASGARLNLAQETAAAIDAYTTLEIHQALDNGALSADFSEHLGNLLGGIVEKLHGPFGAFAAGMRKTEAGNPLAVWLKAIETGKAPFASSIVASGFAGSAQEDFAMQQVEATVKAALEGNEATSKAVYRELSKLYTEMRAKLKPSDFASQEDYDFVFKLETGKDGRSDYLSRFAAMGLASEKFNTLLKVATERDTRTFGQGKTLGERLLNVFEKILAFFNEKITHTYAGQNADAKLQALVEQLVDIEARKRHMLKVRATESSFLAPVEEGVKNFADAVREKVGDAAGSEFVRNNANAFVRAAGGLARTVANDQVEMFLEGLQRLRDREFKGRPGFAASLVIELKGPLERFNALLRETKKNEADRKKIITQHSQIALKAFLGAGKSLSKEAKASISSILMRTGLHNLLGDYTMAQIESLVSDQAVLDKAIETTENMLSTGLKNRHIEQANALGYFKATGKARAQVLMLNAHLIARMSDTPFAGQISEAEAASQQETIAKLVSLYALKYSSKQDCDQAREVIRTENARNDGNGAEFVLKLHKAMEAESLARLFKGNPALMIHGYTPEILNPHTAIKIADSDEGTDLMNQGYSLGARVFKDPSDPNPSNKSIYVLRDGGLAPYLSGVFSLSSMQARGTKLHNGYLNVNNQTGLANASNQVTLTNMKMRAMKANNDPRRDLSEDNQNNMVPVYNDHGKIVNWRYVMAEHTKNDLLERDNRFDNILGALAGSIYDKETSQEQNAKAVRSMRDLYEEEYATQRDAYIEVGARSADPEMRAIWDLLPDATQREIRKVWGRDAVMVRKDSLDIMFGYRKLSLATMFQKDPEAQNHLEKLFVGVMETVLSNYAGYKHGMTPEDARNYAKRASVIVTRGERAWQELVREVKDIIVIKTGVVMLGNIWSNLSFLALSGVPLKDVLSHHLVAIKAATAYQTDSKRLAEMETLLALGYTQGNDRELQREVIRLKDAISRNPVKELIEAGLMPTIVEDVSVEEDPYSYKSEFARRTERFTNRINPAIRNVARTVYMAHDTPMYNTLSKITQLSDFVARYTLYQHLVSRKDNPLSKVDAISEASDAFVNYDIPMHRLMQYGDDMGVLMFTKYFMRIQRVLLKLARDNPARVFTAILLNNYLNLGPIVLDSHFAHHIGNNPFGIGAFQLPMVLDDLATVQAGMAVVK